MKKKKLLLVPLVSLLLFSCNQNKKSQEPSSNVINSSDITQISSNNSSSSNNDPNIVNIELFALNDFHGNVKDSTNGLGIAKTSSLLKSYPKNANNALYVSQGDMWQGSAESNLTRGQLVTDWMNQLGFVSMTLGNHEFDWSTKYVEENSKLANFPFLGINVYAHENNQIVSYAKPSVVVEKNGAKIGIVGAIGDCYSSISASQVKDIYFKVGEELTSLVKQEAIRLKEVEKCDFVIYSIHDDDSYYDVELSNYVDLVLEGHTHQNYIRKDSKGIYHIQGAGYNKSFNYINLDINIAEDSFVINQVKSIYTNDFSNLVKEDQEANSLFTKYADTISRADDELGYNSRYRDSTELRQLIADLYLENGLKKWGQDYDELFLAGGYISCRTPYRLNKGNVTYADLYTLFPFDNDLVLCTTTGYYLDRQFVNSTNENYFISYTSYGSANRSSINKDETYYLITDTYSSDYAPNHLTVIDRYTNEGYYARDMVAEYIKAGRMN